MATGRVLQFDHTRGYGFVAADDGGEDVFLHASTFDGDPEEISSGMRVEFQVMAGDRGRKAFAAHLINDDIDLAGKIPEPSRPVLSSIAQVAAAPIATTLPTAVSVDPDEEQLCDVLSPVEFCQEITELLISTAPDLTGHQIAQIRQNMLEFAKKHGWSDG